MRYRRYRWQFRRRWAFGRGRIGRRLWYGHARVHIGRVAATVLENPFVYLVLCIVLVILLVQVCMERAGNILNENTAETAESQENGNLRETWLADEGELLDWQLIWEEMNRETVQEADVYPQNGSDVSEDMEQSSKNETIPGDGMPSVNASGNTYGAYRFSLIEKGDEIRPVMARCLKETGYSIEQMRDFNFLFRNFYTLNSGTSITPEQLDAELLLSKDLSIRGGNDEPQILIYHTHSQESFINSEPGNVEDTIVGVGNRLTEILTEKYGYQVIHHTGIYDMTDGVLDRDPAYTKACPEIERILEEYPSIEIVIDLHRDGVREDVHLVTEIDGKPTARIMFFNGVCRDDKGELEELPNPYREDNLAFSLQMRLASMTISPDFCRTNYLKSWRYNQQFLGRCILIEVGAQTNTVEEEMNAMEPLAKALDMVLRKE